MQGLNCNINIQVSSTDVHLSKAAVALLVMYLQTAKGCFQDTPAQPMAEPQGVYPQHCPQS